MANWTWNENMKAVFVERLKGLLERTKTTNAEIERAMDISQPTLIDAEREKKQADRRFA